MSLSEPELRLRERRLARREQVLRAREAELRPAGCSPDRVDALLRELVDVAPPARLPRPVGAAPGLLGVWLLASPVVLGFAAEGAAWSCTACGVVMTLAAGLAGARRSLASWAVVAASVWLIASALWLHASSGATIDCAVSGALGLPAGLAPFVLRAWSRPGDGAGRTADDPARLG